MVMTVLQYTYTDLYGGKKSLQASTEQTAVCVCVDGCVGVRACVCMCKVGASIEIQQWD